MGRFSDPVARELLDPAERVVVDQVRAGRVPTGAGDRMTYELVRRTGLTMVPRTITIDEAIRDHAAGQLVILGAGLDARAWRMPDLGDTTVFEVDHPASQRDKLRRVGGLAPTARRVVPVAVDLASERLGPALERAGLDRQAVTTWVWEGVVPYLTGDEVRATVAQIAELVRAGQPARGQLPGEVAADGRHACGHAAGAARVPTCPTRWPASRGARCWRPDGIRSMLRDHGFDVISDSDLLTLSEGLALPPGTNGSLRNGRVAVAVHR